MKKIKVENISHIKLDFFLRQNKEDVRIILSPGEISWCDNDSPTKSMVLYERKQLIKSYEEVELPIVKVAKKVAVAISINLVPVEKISESNKETIISSTFDIIHPAKNIEIKKSEEGVSEKKNKGKKRGRKKKRGPKPGAKKRKDMEIKKAAIEQKKIDKENKAQ